MIRENKQTRIKLSEDKNLNKILMKIQKGEILTKEEKEKVNIFHGLNKKVKGGNN